MREFNTAVVRVKDDSGGYKSLSALRGESSYAIAVQNGFEGTEEEWMESIIGDGWIGAFQDLDTRVETLEDKADEPVSADDISGTLSISKGGTGAINKRTAAINLWYLGENPVTSDTDTPSTWVSLGPGYAYIFGSNITSNQPTTDGLISNHVCGDLVAQTWQQLSSNGRTFHRSGTVNEGWYGSWVEDYNSYNLNPATLDSNGKVTASQTCSRIIEVATATRTLAASDAGCMLMTRNANATSQNYTITVPLNSDVEIPVGTEIEILRYYGGTVTITAPTNVYLLAVGCIADRSGQSITINNRYGVCALKKVYSNYWIASGDVSVV